MCGGDGLRVIGTGRASIGLNRGVEPPRVSSVRRFYISNVQLSSASRPPGRGSDTTRGCLCRANDCFAGCTIEPSRFFFLANGWKPSAPPFQLALPTVHEAASSHGHYGMAHKRVCTCLYGVVRNRLNKGSDWHHQGMPLSERSVPRAPRHPDNDSNHPRKRLAFHALPGVTHTVRTKPMYSRGHQ